MQLSHLSFDLANHVIALMASEIVGRDVAAMEPTEYQEFLAGHMQGVLLRHGIAGKPADKAPPIPGLDPPPQEQTEAPPSRITDDQARRLLENAPGGVRGVYGRGRRNGKMPVEALEEAMAELRRMQEAAAENQETEYAENDSGVGDGGDHGGVWENGGAEAGLDSATHAGTHAD